MILVCHLPDTVTLARLRLPQDKLGLLFNDENARVIVSRRDEIHLCLAVSANVNLLSSWFLF